MIRHPPGDSPLGIEALKIAAPTTNENRSGAKRRAAPMFCANFRALPRQTLSTFKIHRPACKKDGAGPSLSPAGAIRLLLSLSSLLCSDAHQQFSTVWILQRFPRQGVTTPGLRNRFTTGCKVEWEIHPI